MHPIDDVLSVLNQSLQLGDRTREFSAQTRLLGNLPELDSMAIINLITGLEEHFGFRVDDDEISADTFETVGTLCEFVTRKLAG
jgi:acyl carrier protein